jgi:hypothetical protein
VEQSILQKKNKFDGDVLRSRTSCWTRAATCFGCAPRTYDAVWKAGVRVETGKASELYPVVVTGTSGIGKSFFRV